MAQPQVKQRVAEDAVDQGRGERAEVGLGRRAVTAFHKRGGGVRLGRRPGRRGGPGGDQLAVEVATGITNHQGMRSAGRCGRANPQLIAFQGHDLAQPQGVAPSVEQPDLASRPGIGGAAWWSRADQRQLGQRELGLAGSGQPDVPVVAAAFAALRLAGRTGSRVRRQGKGLQVQGATLLLQRKRGVLSGQHQQGADAAGLGECRQQFGPGSATHHPGAIQQQRPSRGLFGQALHRLHQWQAEAGGIQGGQGGQGLESPAPRLPATQTGRARWADGGQPRVGAQAVAGLAPGGQARRGGAYQGGLAAARHAGHQHALVTLQQGQQGVVGGEVLARVWHGGSPWHRQA